MRLGKSVLAAIAVSLLWAMLALYLSLFGFWMSPVASPDSDDEFESWALGELAQRNVGNAALVLITKGEVTTSEIHGQQRGIDEATLFPTASFGKWIAALAVMSLVESNRIDLDAPIAGYLTRWQLPKSDVNNGTVSVRQLLSHTAGLTDGLGFGDYTSEEVLPSLEESLQNPRTSDGASKRISVGIEPGSQFSYSGGGYLILELLVEEVTGMPYAEYATQAILAPLGMTRSSFAYLTLLDNVSNSYHVDGTVAPTYQYASAAATAFSSSVVDLVKLVRALAFDATVLSASSLKSMREPHGYVLGAPIWGLGTILYAPTDGGDYVYGHDGANEPAINASVRINPESGDAIVVLVTGEPSLATDIGSEWVLWQTGMPDFFQTERALRSAIFPIVIGIVLIGLAFLLFSNRRAS